MPENLLALSAIVVTDLAPDRFVHRVQELEQAGVRRVWTYDHISWRTLRNGPWFGAIPVLAAAAAATRTIRLGTLVATPNFRHPVLLAKDAIAVDHISGGRLDLGIGAGTDGDDAAVLGHPRWARRERTDRFLEWATLLDDLLRQGSTTSVGTYYSAHDATMFPGPRQHPSIPLTIAAAGPRGMRLAVQRASTWVTYGDVHADGTGGRNWLAAALRQSRELDEVLQEVGPRPLRRMLCLGIDHRDAFDSAEAYRDISGQLADAGFTDLAAHWPRQDGRGVPQRALDYLLPDR